MTNLTFRITTFVVAICLGISAYAADYGGGKDLNKTDEAGQRQGYWLIKGYMVNDQAYGPDALVEEGEYKDNRKEGLWKKYWPNGKTKSEITYLSGRPEGSYKIYYDNGKVEEDANWISGNNTGEFKRFHANGQPQQLFTFADNGKRNGVQKYFHENGKVAMEVNINMGTEQGMCKRYNEDGTLKEESQFASGDVKPGTLKEYTDKAGGEDVVADPHNNEMGKPAPAVNTDKVNEATQFKPNGYNIMYNKLDQMTQVGQFKDGKLSDGKWYIYNSDGLLMRIEVYRKGKYLGTGVLEDE
ncbi:MAG: toxin-antitoxin system YwqK family antitoxin [Flavobacteriales bacterium]|nr:toxin-antitoxin system YwqK family antitoxin [Flavobacteriales bacterium]